MHWYMVQGIRKLRKRKLLQKMGKQKEKVLILPINHHEVVGVKNIRRRIYIIWINLQLKQETKTQPN